MSNNGKLRGPVTRFRMSTLLPGPAGTPGAAGGVGTVTGSGFLHATNGALDTPASHGAASQLPFGGASDIQWAAPGGDVALSGTTFTVGGLQGRPVASTAPATGNTLGWNGSTWAPGALNLAGGAGYVTGTLPVGNLPNLSPDVTGPLTSNAVVQMTGAGGVVSVPTASLVFGATAAQSGYLRVPNNTVLAAARNVGNTADVTIAKVDNSNILQIGDAVNSIQTAIISAGNNVLYGGGLGAGSFVLAASTYCQLKGSSQVYVDTPSLVLRDYSTASVITGTLNGSGATTLQIGTGVTSFTLNQATPTSDVIPANLTIAAQVALPAATTHLQGGSIFLNPGAGATTNGFPGNVVISYPAATGTGTTQYNSGCLQIQQGGTTIVQLGQFPSSGFSALWLSQSTPNGYNFSFLANATQTQFNATSQLMFSIGNNVAFPMCANASGVQFFNGTPAFAGGIGVLGIPTATAIPTANPSGGIVLYATGASIGTLGISGVGIAFAQYGASVTITQTSTSTGSGATLTIQAQGATGASNAGGNLVLASGTSGSSTVGLLKFGVGATTVGQFGIAANDFLAFGAIPATTGPLRVSNNTFGTWRNAGNTADVIVVGLDSGNTTILGPTSGTVGDTVVNAGPGRTVHLNIGGTNALWVQAALTSFDSAVATPLFGQITPGSDLATTSLTVQAQSAFATASSFLTGGALNLKGGNGANTNGVGGAVNISGGAPGTGVTTSAVNFQTNSVTTMTVSDGGWNPVSQAVTVTATGTTTLTQAQYKFPLIVVNSVTSTSAVLQFPNVAGVWFLDISAVTISGSFSVSSGSSASVALAVGAATKLVIVRCSGSNGITVNN
jgi:collagen type I alpha